MWTLYHEDFYNLQFTEPRWTKGDFGISGPSIATTQPYQSSTSGLTMVGDFGTLFALNSVTIGCLAEAALDCTIDIIGDLGPVGATEVSMSYTVNKPLAGSLNFETVDLGGLAGLFPNLYRLEISPRYAGTLVDNISLSDQVPYGGGGGDVPEPATVALVGAAFLGVAASRRRRPAAPTDAVR